MTTAMATLTKISLDRAIALTAARAPSGVLVETGRAYAVKASGFVHSSSDLVHPDPKNPRGLTGG